MATSIEEIVRGAAGTALRLPCADALALAERLGVEPQEVGAAADTAGVKIVRCELGLFGPRRLDTSGHGDDHVPGTSALVGRLSSLPTKELSCAEAWAIAREQGAQPMEVAQAAFSLRLHIHQCQLGCF